MTIEYLNPDYLGPSQRIRLRSGDDYKCEEAAAVILAKSREGITALSEKRDFLTADQLKLRYQKEVPNQNGFSDESLMSGMFRREYNPLFGNRPGARMHSGEE